MKRFLSILLAALLIVSSIATVTFADAATTMTVDNVSAKAGETVEVYVTLANTPKLSGGGFLLDYDKENLELIVIKVVGIPAAQGTTDGNKTYGSAAFAIKPESDTNEDGEPDGYPTCDGKVLQMKFKIAEDAQLGKYDIDFTTRDFKVTDESGAESTIDYTYTPGSITVRGKDFTTAPKFEGELNPTYNDEAHKLTVVGDDILKTEVPVVYYEGTGETVYPKSETAPTDAGTYTVTSTVAPAGYTPVELEATLTINKRPLEITGLTASERQYDGTCDVKLEGGILEGVIGEVGADNVTATMPTTGTIENANAGDDKVVTISKIEPDGAKKDNYTLEQPTVKVKIKKRPITITTGKVTVVTGTSNLDIHDKVTAALDLKEGSTLPEGEALLDIVIPSFNYGEFANANSEGEYPITKNPDFGYTEHGTTNYDVTFEDGVLSVKSKNEVKVNVSIIGKTYDGTPIDGLTYSEEALAHGTTGLQEPTSIKYTGTAFDGEAYNSTDAPTKAGNYRVTVVYETETVGDELGLYGSNYADFTIAKANYVMDDVTLSGVTEYGYTHIDEIALTVENLPSADVTVKNITYKLDEAEAVDVPDAAGIYDVIVAFENKDANYNDPDAKVFENALTILAEAPTAVTIKTSVSSKKITVTVTANANGKPITDYQVSIDNTNWKTAIIVDGKGTYEFTTLEDGTELENGTEYTIYAKATNGIGEYVNADNTGIKATPKAQQNTSRPISNSNKLPSGDLGSVTDSDKPSTDEPSTDEPGTEEPGTEEPGTEEPGTEEPGTDEPATDEPAEDIEIVVDPDEEVAVINPAEAVEKDAETGAIVWKNTYEDVKADEWYADAVGFAKTTGLMNGVGETTFAPDATLTRGMFATVLYRLVDAPETAQKVGFKDVADNAWYADAINWGVKNGVINGVGGASFAPENEVTREQMATMIYRFANLLGYTADGAELAFNDAADVADYATEAFAWCTANGIINGVSDTELAPQETATRAQAAAVFMRAVEFFNK